ncbi:DUF3540 domain-containing protein [Polaromonas sp.]|uniref:DUF3540 domain-containing protein n=1 Tax=Polaromonas sp. TaxID=1869339 RepID=UPI0037C74378
MSLVNAAEIKRVPGLEERNVSDYDAEQSEINKQNGIFSGVVLSISPVDNKTMLGLSISVKGHFLPVIAKVAAACLLRPETGDLVLLCHMPDQERPSQTENWWVLSVLQRALPASPATLAVPGAKLVSLDAPELGLAASGRLNVTAGDVTVNTLKTTLHTGSLKVVASTAHIVARQLTRMVQVFHSLADTITEHCRTRVAVVDEVNSTQSGSELIESKDVMLLKGGQVLLDAKKSVRIDGEHILMG